MSNCRCAVTRRPAYIDKPKECIVKLPVCSDTLPVCSDILPVCNDIPPVCNDILPVRSVCRPVRNGNRRLCIPLSYRRRFLRGQKAG